MKEYLLLLPIIFIFHDMEEIIGFECFFKKNPWLYEKYPRVMKAYREFTNMAFSIAVYEEFIPFFGVSLLAYYFPCKVLYALWFGLFLSLTLHFIVHIAFGIKIKKYIPSIITSVICLPVSILILIQCIPIITFDLITILCIIISMPLMMLNLKLAHKLGKLLNKKIKLD